MDPALDRPTPCRYSSYMNRRLVAFLLILAMGLQGPMLAYAAAPGGTGPSSATIAACPDGTVLHDGNECSSCCSHGSMPAGCISVCAVPMASTVLALPDLSYALDAVPPSGDSAPFTGRQPVPPIRPPIG